MRRVRIRTTVAVATIVLVLAAPAVAPAQDGATATASPVVEPGHWTLEAARRLDGLGLVPAGYDVSAGTVTRREIAEVFARAAFAAELEHPAVASLAYAYRARLTEDFGATVAARSDSETGGARLLSGRAHIRYERRTGGVRAGVGYDTEHDWTGVRPVDDARFSASGARMSVAFGTRASVTATPVYRQHRWQLGETYAVVRGGPVAFWAGRRIVGLGAGARSGIVLNRSTMYDGIGMYLGEPVRLPGALEGLGPIRFETFLSRFEQNAQFEHPGVWAMRGSIAPHPRLTIGVNRGIMFGGEGNTKFDLLTFAEMAVGKHSGEAGEYDNQVVSVDLRYRVPGDRVPLVAYLEWGMEDSSGAWYTVPGIISGVEMPAVPGLPQVALGVERTSFGSSCCGNPMWYRNWSFRDGWTKDGRPLGHPLGGHGREWLGTIRADLLDAQLRVRGHLFDRRRGNENLYAPERAGRSRGAELSAAFRPLRQLEVHGRGEIEVGAGGGWRRMDASLTVRVLF